MADDPLKRHDLMDAEWVLLEPMLPAIRGRDAGGTITGW
jgi:hypothetical protein